MLRRARQWVSRYPRLEHAYRVGVGILGGALTGLGVLLIPLPGPGWLVVFLGLAVLGTEFRWAKRIAVWLKRQLDRFWAWWKARARAARGGEHDGLTSSVGIHRTRDLARARARRSSAGSARASQR